MELPPFPTELLPSVHVPDTSALEDFPFPPAPPIYATEAASRVSLHPDAEKNVWVQTLSLCNRMWKFWRY